MLIGYHINIRPTLIKRVMVLTFVYFFTSISGTGLNDSPVGLAAYILEKFSTWTDESYVDLPDGGLTKVRTPFYIPYTPYGVPI